MSKMRTQLESRLKQLKAEYEAGQRELADLEQKQAAIKQTLDRLNGAIKVIEQQLSQTKP
jgi:predicted nuclease with TOPRIM domain